MVRPGGSLMSGDLFCVRAFGRNLASVAKMFYKDIYKCSAFNEILKDNAVVNCVSFEHNKNLTSINFDEVY